MELPAAKERSCPRYWMAWQSGETAPLRFLLSRFHQVGSTEDSFSGHWADGDWVAKYSTKVHIQRRQAEFLTDFREDILKVKYMTRHFTEIQLFILFFFFIIAHYCGTLIRILLDFHKARKRQGASHLPLTASKPAHLCCGYTGPTLSPVSFGIISSRHSLCCLILPQMILCRAQWGFWAQRLSVSSIFLITGNCLPPSLHDLPWVEMGRIKQLLNKKGRGCKIREK